MPKKKKGHDHWQTNQSGKRADRAAKHALRRERKRQAIRQRLSDKEFVSFDNQLQAQGLTLKDVLGDGYVLAFGVIFCVNIDCTHMNLYCGVKV